MGRTGPRRAVVSPFQSLLSQGISLLAAAPGPNAASTFPACFNPFLVRASVYCVDRACEAASYTAEAFQSLLSQGISLLLILIVKGMEGST